MKSAVKTFLFAAIGAVLLIAILGAGFFTLMAHHFHPSPPRGDSSPVAGPLEAQRADIRYFRELLALDRSFSPADRMQADRRLDSLAALSTPVDLPHFRVSLMRVDALADNGHSQVEDGDGAPSSALPVHVAAFSDGLHIMRATAGHADLLGGRVTAVDGQAIDLVMDKLGQLRGGTSSWRALLASEYLTRQDLLYGIDVARDPRQSDWTIETPSGETITERLEVLAAPASEFAPVTRWLSSEPPAGGPGYWSSLKPDHDLPLSLMEFDAPFRRLPIPGSCAYLVQLKSNADEHGRSIRAFLSEAGRRLQEMRPCGVIFDLRFDSGGDYLNTYWFARRLPRLIPREGRVLVLTGPATFSAGITTIAALKHADPQRVVILGEPVGDRLQFYSEGGRACLPHQPLCLDYETGKHDYQHPCTDWDVCFWLNHFFALQVNSLQPDEIVPWSFKDWRAGIDPVLERAIALSKVPSRP